MYDRMNEARQRRRGGANRPSRRGVASVLSMMFLVIFGSLAAAMAVVAHGNMRTAHSGLQVNRAMSAAETGLVFASRRLKEEASKFIIDKGVVDEGFADRLWMGGPYLPSDGTVESPGGNGYGIIHAIRDAHLADQHWVIVQPGDQNLPEIDSEFGILRVRPIALDVTDSGNPDPNGPYFRLRYEMLVSGDVRVISQGVDGDVRRTLQVDFSISKRIEYAVLSPSRIMIGKNVLVEGPIGSLFGTEPGELNSPNGHPLRMHSDFYHLDNSLDASISQFHQAVQEFDIDGDNRLRVHHPVESQGLLSTGFSDMTGDGYVDEFDIFLHHYGNGNPVVYDALLAGAGANFNDDTQLGRLIDLARPDRDGDGEITISDHQLGYADGILDHRDNYAKVHGRLLFAVSREAWESAHGGFNYQEVVQGPIRPGIDRAAVSFEVGEPELRAITTDMFNDSSSWFKQKAESGADFWDQVNGSGGTYTPPGPDTWEGVPFGSAAPYDHFQRPVFEDMTFLNVKIPRGLNALFINCTFIGVTYIDTETDNGHINWNVAGAYQPDNSMPPNYTLRWPNLEAELDGEAVPDTREHSNNIRFHDCTFLGSIAGERPLHYTHWRNKIQMTGTTRFYLDVDDDDLAEQPDAAQLISHLNSLPESDKEELAKSSILMPGWSMDVGSFISDPDADPNDAPIIKLRGTIVAGLLDIRGRADVHGTLLMTFRPQNGEHPLTYAPSDCYSCLASFSTTIGYFGPDYGDYESFDPSDDEFMGYGEIRLRYNPNAKLPDGIPWPVRVEPRPHTYTEGGAL